MALFLKREGFRIGQAEDRHAFGPHFPCLALARRGHQLADHGQGRAGIGFAQSRVGLGTFVHNALHVGEAGAVVDLHKGKALGVAAGAHPAADGNGVLRLFGVEGVDDQGSLHGMAPCGWISLRKNLGSVAFPRARLKGGTRQTSVAGHTKRRLCDRPKGSLTTAQKCVALPFTGASKHLYSLAARRPESMAFFAPFFWRILCHLFRVWANAIPACRKYARRSKDGFEHPELFILKAHQKNP